MRAHVKRQHGGQGEAPATSVRRRLCSEAADLSQSPTYSSLAEILRPSEPSEVDVAEVEVGAYAGPLEAVVAEVKVEACVEPVEDVAKMASEEVFEKPGMVSVTGEALMMQEVGQAAVQDQAQLVKEVETFTETEETGKALVTEDAVEEMPAAGRADLPDTPTAAE